MVLSPSYESSFHRPLVYWYQSFRCNLACKHCWVNSSPFVDTSKDLTTEEALATVQQLKDLQPSRVVLSGGEALLRRDILDIIGALITHRIDYVIESNGILITPKLVQLVKQGIIAGVSGYFSISLDGGTREAHEWNRGRHSFHLTLKGLEKLAQAGIPCTVQCVINRKNIDSISGLFEIAEDYPNITTLAFAVVNPIGRGQENFDQLGLHFEDYPRIFKLIHDLLQMYQSTPFILLKVPPAVIPPRLFSAFMSYLKEGRVGIMTSCSFPLLGILPDGTVTICALTREDEYLRLGNVKTDSLKRIWSSVKIQSLRQAYEEVKLTGVCANCVFNRICKGSCRAFAYDRFGSFTSPHPLCESFYKNGRFPEAYMKPPAKLAVA